MFTRNFLSGMTAIGLSIGCLCTVSGKSSKQSDEENTYISFHRIDKAWSVSKGKGVKVAVLDWLFDMSPQASEKYVDPISLIPG
jgi:hypothetical protein